jgi:F-type H+-transporting ATPase subunit delta
VKSDTLARRYAKALLASIPPGEDVDEAGDQLQAISTALLGSGELFRFLAGPLLQPRHVDGLVQLLVQAGVLPEVAQFTGLLIKRRRLRLLDRIVLQYRLAADAVQHRLTAHVQSATQLAPDLVQPLTARLAALFAQDIRLELTVEPALLGGIVTRVGSIVLDGSMRNQLQRLQTYIRERPLG